MVDDQVSASHFGRPESMRDFVLINFNGIFRKGWAKKIVICPFNIWFKGWKPRFFIAQLIAFIILAWISNNGHMLK